jgi:hypothetical protein
MDHFWELTEDGLKIEVLNDDGFEDVYVLDDLHHEELLEALEADLLEEDHEEIAKWRTLQDNMRRILNDFDRLLK